MKPISYLAAAVTVGASIIVSAPSLAGCYPRLAYADYVDYKSVSSKKNALKISLKENYDGSSDCQVKINARFMKKEGWKPF